MNNIQTLWIKNPYTDKQLQNEDSDELMHLETKEGKENKVLSI